VLGKSVRVRTRYAYDCVLDRLSWDSPIWLTHEAEGEVLSNPNFSFDSIPYQT
jgi:hypothetical protein